MRFNIKSVKGQYIVIDVIIIILLLLIQQLFSSINIASITAFNL